MSDSFDLDHLAETFPKYTAFDPDVPVWCITPGKGRCIHRFFDTSPVSPSGRYVGLTRLPFEDRAPEPGDTAEVIVVDLMTGSESVVATTRGWDTQLGAQVQWGAEDGEFFFNDIDDAWRPFGVKMDPLTGDRRRLDSTVYVVTRDGRFAASPDLRLTGSAQRGYGVLVPDDHVPEGASDADGVFVTDTETGISRLLVSLADVAGSIGLNRSNVDGGFRAFHVKWNPQGTRLMLVLVWLPHSGRQSRNVGRGVCTYPDQQRSALPRSGRDPAHRSAPGVGSPLPLDRLQRV